MTAAKRAINVGKISNFGELCSIIIILGSFENLKKKIKIVPIIPPPGPRCRSFGDPFGSDPADITAAGILPGMGGIQGRNLGDP